MLVDTSAWVEYLRGTGSPTHLSLRDTLASGVAVLTCDAVALEVFAGARSDTHLDELRALFARMRRIAVVDGDGEFAAQLYRAGRRSGSTVRSLLDCLIAAVAIREGVEVLHRDRDFDALARVSPLRVRTS